MKAVVLSAVPTDDLRHLVLAYSVERALSQAGYATETFQLAATTLAFCQGEFDCWVKTPGACKIHDAEEQIVQAVHDSDVVVLVGPETFGGHGYVMKRALDRFLCLITPFFEVRHSLTHHVPRYQKAPKFFTLAWQAKRDEQRLQTFRDISEANAINFYSNHMGFEVIDDDKPETWDETIQKLLASTKTPGADISDRSALTASLVESAKGSASPRIITSAEILIGSAKPKGTSTSEALARALGDRLNRIGLTTNYTFATEFVHDNERTRAVAAKLAKAELLILATPLYVDALPALVTHGLEMIATARAGMQDESRVAALMNCGFPEPEHIRSAFRVVQHFADSAAMGYAGGLALGGGGSIAGKPLDDHASGPAAHVAKALDLASISLVRFGRVSEEATAAMIERAMPDMVYRLAGDVGFRWAARTAGVSQGDLKNRPLDASK